MAAPSWVVDLANRHGAQWGIPPALLAALWWRESGWDPCAVGDGGCSYGLGQLNFCGGAGTTFQQRDGVTPEQIQCNAELGARYSAEYLAMQYQRWGDWTRAVSGYNCPACAESLSNSRYYEPVLAKWQELAPQFATSGPVAGGETPESATAAVVAVLILAVLVGVI